jgi:hypothetical protein
MLFRTRWQIPAACLMLTAFSATGDAQERATSFDQLRMLVRTGDTLTVHDISGHAIEGKIGALSPSSIELVTAQGRSRLSEPEVVTVTQRQRPVRKGMKYGVALGAALGAVAGLRSREPGYFLAGAIFFGGIGTGIGAGLGAAAPRDTVIFSHPDAAARKVTVSPLLGGRKRGVRVTVGF